MHCERGGLTALDKENPKQASLPCCTAAQPYADTA